MFYFPSELEHGRSWNSIWLKTYPMLIMLQACMLRFWISAPKSNLRHVTLSDCVFLPSLCIPSIGIVLSMWTYSLRIFGDMKKKNNNLLKWNYRIFYCVYCLHLYRIKTIDRLKIKYTLLLTASPDIFSETLHYKELERDTCSHQQSW